MQKQRKYCKVCYQATSWLDGVCQRCGLAFEQGVEVANEEHEKVIGAHVHKRKKRFSREGMVNICPKCPRELSPERRVCLVCGTRMVFMTKEEYKQFKIDKQAEGELESEIEAGPIPMPEDEK